MRIKNANGFTIFELMIVFALIGVITAIAAPRISDAFNRFEFSNGMRLMLGTVARAKGEAMNSGWSTSVSFATAADGRVNYTAFVDNGNGGGTASNGLRDGSERIITTGRMPSGASLAPAATTLTNNATGDPFTQFNATGFPMGFTPGLGVPLWYNGNVQLTTQIGGQTLIQGLGIATSGRLQIYKI